MKIRVVVLLFCFIILSGNQSFASEPMLRQVSTMGMLDQGMFEGNITWGELKETSDFGIGTLNGLDGEVVVTGGKFLVIRSDGRVYDIQPGDKCPFGVLTRFDPQLKLELEGSLNYEELKTKLDAMLPSKKDFYAIRINCLLHKGLFRSVPKQVQPYPTLAIALRNQVLFHKERIQGTLVGFRTPEYLERLNSPGYHFHFISDDLTSGGHVLDLSLLKGVAEISRIKKIETTLLNHQGD